MQQAIIRMRTLILWMPILGALPLVRWSMVPLEGGLSAVAFALSFIAYVALPLFLLACLIRTFSERRLTARRFVIMALAVGGLFSSYPHFVEYKYMKQGYHHGHSWSPATRREVDWVSTGLTAVSLATGYLLTEPLIGKEPLDDEVPLVDEDPFDDEDSFDDEPVPLEHPMRDRWLDG